MAGHTPGPWRIWMGDVAVLIQNQDNPRYPDNIAKVFRRDPNGNDPRPYEANASLIAAAPDLFSAVLALLEPAGDTDVQVRAQARAALNKATGEQS